jgi:hypothetical protein
MIYKIIQEDSNEPLEIGVFTNKGFITKTFDDGRLFEVDYQDSLWHKGSLYPIKMSLREFTNIETAIKNCNTFVKEKEKALELVKPKNGKYQLIKCDTELQKILFDKLSNGIEEITSDEVEVNFIWGFPDMDGKQEYYGSNATYIKRDIYQQLVYDIKDMNSHQIIRHIKDRYIINLKK